MNTQFYTFDMIGLESLFKYSSVYNTTLHPENLLISLDRKILIENLLYLLRSQPKFVNFIDFCNIYISSETDDIVLLKRVYNEIIESNINNLPYKIISYSNQTILNLLAISFSLPPSNNLQAECDDNFRLKIVKAILAENEKIDNDKKKYILAENLPEPLSTSYILAMNILPYDDFTNNNSNAKLITACIKAAKLFDFCYKTNTYIDLINTFLEKYKCENYLKYLHNVLKLFFTSNDEQIIYITLDSKDVNYLSDLLMLRSLSISINQIISLEDNIDYVYFRNKPIIEIQENSFIIISRNLLADKIFNGIFFDLNVINQQQHIVKDFFIDYTTKFSEQYLFYGIIEKMISKHKYISFNGEDFRKSNIKGEPDYYIRNWNDILGIIFTRPFEQNGSTFEKANYPVGLVNGGGGCICPSQNLLDAFEVTIKDGSGKVIGTEPFDWNNPNHTANPYNNRDPRLGMIVVTNGSKIGKNTDGKDHVVETFKGGVDGIGVKYGATTTGYYLRKMLAEDFDLSKTVAKPKSWVLMRYAEFLLNYAEAVNRVVGPDGTTIDGITLVKTARQAVNEIRNRDWVKLPEIANVNNTTSMESAIRHERQVELAFEDQRFFDVRRWKIASETENKPLYGINIYKDLTGGWTYEKFKVEERKFEEKMYYYPIPYSEIMKSNGILVQNDGWE